MRLWKSVWLVTFLALATPLAAGEVPTLDQVVAELTGKAPVSERTLAKLDETYHTVLGLLLPKLIGENADERQDAERTWKAICWHAARPGADAQRTAAAKATAARLSPSLPQHAALYLLRRLETVGRDESVETLDRLLHGKDALLRERARCTLQVNSSPQAAEALRRALRKAADPAWQLALANAIGARRDKGAVPVLIPLATSDDEGVRMAACHALARIGDAAAVAAIARATTIKGTDRGWHDVCRSYLLLADQLAARGDKAAALGMYRHFLKSSGYLKCAAVIGLGRAGGADELPLIFEALAGGDAEVRGAGMAALDLLPIEVVRRAITERAKAASPEMKARLLQVLIRRGDRGALPTLTAAAGDAHEAVRIAAIDGMGELGDPEAVPTLLKALTRAEGRELEAVKAALGRIPGERVDKALIQALAGAQPTLRVQLIQILADRRAQAAVPTLLRAAEDQDGKVRAEAFKALGAYADAEALPRLVTLLVAAKGKPDRDAAEKALVAVGSRSEDEAKRVEPLVAALGTTDVPARCALLRVLGRLAGPKALEAVRAGIKSEEAEVREAAVRALGQWPDAAAVADLLALAKEAQDLTEHVLALRGYVRVVGLPSDRPVAATLRLYEDGLKAARRPDEKRLVLAGLADVPVLGALKMVEPFLDDPQLKGEAAIAAAKVASAISGSHRQEAEAALKKVLEVAEDESLREVATDALAQIDLFADYITAWQVSGPYTRPGADGPGLHNVAFPPEGTNAKDAAWGGMAPGGGERQFYPFLMDLHKRFDAKENAAAYLRTWVWSPERQEAQLEFGSDDGAKLWLNGKLTINTAAPRSFEPGKDKVAVTLVEGWNALLVKVWNGGGHWSAAVRFRKPDGSALEGLRASIERE